MKATPWKSLVVASVLSITAWWAVQAQNGNFTHDAYPDMMRAAQTMQAATQVARVQRTKLGLLQGKELDPNKTGLIGSEYTDTTTSLGDLPAKRTATNPDLAAAITRRILELDLPEGAPAMVVLSGSFIGANIATIIAVEAAGLRPIIVSSLGSSMYGATDAELTWLDIEGELHAKGIIASRSIASLIGGGSATGSNMSDEGLFSLREAAKRNGVELLEGDNLTELLDEVDRRVQEKAGGKLAFFINSGGSVLALGTCLDGDRLPLVVTQALPCSDGIPGMVVRRSRENIPSLHLLSLRGIAADWGLPFDPIPIPLTGNNKQVYGTPTK